MKKVANRKDDLREEILKTIKELPGITTHELGALLEEPYGTMRNMLYRMSQENLVRGELRETGTKGRKAYGYFLGLDEPNTSQEALRTRVNEHQVQSDSVVQDLANQLKALQEWQAWAIRIHPDLNVSRELMQARKMLAAHYDNNCAQEILNGKRDQSPAIKALLEALS